jgi:starch synthase
VPLNVLSVASEAVPLIKTGGLADVAGALPAAVAEHDVMLTTMLPGYPSVLRAIPRARTVHAWDSLLGTPARLLSGKIGPKGAEYPLLVLDAPDLFARDGAPYSDVSGKDWADNWRRFAAFSRAAADIAGGAMVRRGKPQRFDLVHAHDWQAAMTCAYLRFAPYGGEPVPSLMTIHNMAFQGWFDRKVFAQMELPVAAWSMNGVEYHGGVGMLKAGLACASAVTTVSPTYAREIRSGTFGMGLEGLVIARGNAVSGILNGIDTELWNPANDTALAATYTARTLARRAVNKRALEAEFALDEDDGPLFIVVSRLTWQKGMDVLPEVLDHLVGIGGRLALLGSGDPHIEHALFEGAARHPGRIGIRVGYDEDLSHRMQAGGDAILVPSRFEPCGLTQLYGLAYGCIPVVARTGGLADTVIDANPAALAAGCATGIQHDGINYDALSAALTRAVDLYRQPAVWQRLQHNAMKCDFSWKTSGKAYADLYRSLVA